MTAAPSAGVTIITQTRPAANAADAFARFQSRIALAIAQAPGFIEQSVLPPNPPVQADWVILQRFRSAAHATAWLHAPARAALLAEVQEHLVGADDVHLLRDGDTGALPAPVSLVITTRVKRGEEAAFRRWELRIAAAQSQAPGFAGYRLQPPIVGVQEGFVAILRFDDASSLQAWLDSPARAALLAEAAPFTEDVRTRTVQAGFAQWFPDAPASAPAWKQNMVVLLMLYPVVFLFGLLIQTPLLMRSWHWPFWLALFAGNVAGVVLLNWLVPWASRMFGWWLKPGASAWAGTALLLALYAATMALFSIL